MMVDIAVADILGLGVALEGRASLLTLVGEVERGLPLAALDRLAHVVAPDDSRFAFRLVPKATLARRRKGKTGAPGAEPRLSAEEGARVARLAEVWTLARHVWGSETAAREFLFRPHPLLDGRRPVDVVLATEFGRPLVDGILGRLRYGSAA